MFSLIGKFWRYGQRSIDISILWPSCKDIGAHAHEGDVDLVHAKTAFAFHVFNDPAWTKDFSHYELVEYINNLK